MARLETQFQPRNGQEEADTAGSVQGNEWRGFPTEALQDRPGHERQYPLDRIERIIGSIM